MPLLILFGGVAAAIAAALVTYHLLSRPRQIRSISSSRLRPDVGALLFAEGQQPLAVLLSTLVGLGIVSGFLFALFRPFWSAFLASPVVIPTYLGIVVVALLWTRRQPGWRALGSVVLLLLLAAAGRELWKHRPPATAKARDDPAPPAAPQAYRELLVVAPGDGSWSPWVDTYALGAKWFKATRNDFVVGTEAGEAYGSSAQTPRGRYYRFRSADERESRVQVTGSRLSYPPPGTIPEPSVVELMPPGPREDSLTVQLTGQWSDTIVARGALVEFELLEGNTDLYVRDDRGKERIVIISRPDAQKALPVPVDYFFVKPTGWREPMSVKVRFKKP